MPTNNGFAVSHIGHLLDQWLWSGETVSVALLQFFTEQSKASFRKLERIHLG